MASTRLIQLFAPTVAACAWPMMALAQGSAAPPQPSAQLDEVVVTAQRRSENLMDVPVAISSASEKLLAAAHIETTYDLASVVPSLTSYQATGFSMPHIRAIGNTVDSVGIENPVAFYVDGVFYASMTGSLLSLNSVERIEVLKGPQGTLFGRNATGGVIQVITRDPKREFGGSAQLGYGNYQTITGNLYVTGGLTDTLAADFAVYYNDRQGGYGKNLQTGQDVGLNRDLALRTKWLWTPTERDTIKLSIDYAENEGNQYVMNRYASGSIPFGAPPFTSSNPWDVNSETEPKGSMEQSGVGLNYTHDFGPMQLVSITGYRKTTAESEFTFSLAPFDIGAHLNQEYSQFSQELQLTSSADSKIKWVVGLFYLDAPSEYDPYYLIGNFLPVIAGAPHPINTAKIDNVSKAVFGQTTIPLDFWPGTNLTLGLRYTSERRSISGEVGVIEIPGAMASLNASREFTDTSWRIGLDHNFSDDLMVYASASRGFKAGTYNGSGTTKPALEKVIEPETLYAYEVGLKSELWDRRLRVTAAAYYYDYKNIQVPIYTATGVEVLNGASAEIYGMDAEAEFAASERLTLSAGLALTHSEFLSFASAPYFANLPGGGLVGFGASADGNELPVSPDMTFNLSATYTVPIQTGSLAASVNYYYKDEWFAGPDNGLAAPATSTINGSVTWTSPDGDYELSLWGRNLTNEEVVARLSPIAPWGDVMTLEPPRTFGVTAKRNF